METDILQNREAADPPPSTGRKPLIKCVYWLEVLICLIVISGALVLSLWPLLAAPNSNFPYTGDAMGHLTKVKYISDCLRQGHWPAWFPFWYNGSTVVQYYPPLSFFLLAPVQILFDNLMITFKFWAFATLLVGGWGVFYICRRWIGFYAGLLGAVLYVMQPFLLRSLMMQGVIAQGPIIALTPWLLAATLLFFERRTPWRWMAICLTIAALILAHPMHALLVCLGMIYVVLALWITSHSKISSLVLWGWAIVVGAGLVSFWWFPGVTHLEMAGLPITVGTEVARAVYTAGSDWFNPAVRRTDAVYYFSPALLALALVSLCFLRREPRKPPQPGQASRYNPITNNQIIIALVISLLGSLTLAFGHKIPGYNYIPMSQAFFPGRILTFGSLLAAILGALVVARLARLGSQRWHKAVLALLIIVILAAVAADINPSYTRIKTLSYSGLRSDLKAIPAREPTFDNGRFGWVCPLGAEVTYFPMLRGMNMTQGWNLEGSIHAYTLLRDNIGLAANQPDYTVKNLLHWNTRSAVIADEYPFLVRRLTDYGFKIAGRAPGRSVLIDSTPSSYFMLANWNALVVGQSSPVMEITYPWMIENYSTFLEDYPTEYLELFDLIYLAEPNMRDFDHFQEIISKLTNKGTMVVIELGYSDTRPLLGVYPYLVNIPAQATLTPTGSSPIKNTVPLTSDPSGHFPALGNLDKVWFNMHTNDQDIPAIGYKEIGGQPVYFVGLALGKQLDAAKKWDEGVAASSSNSQEIKGLLDELMSLSNPNRDIRPVPFATTKAVWQHDGFCFDYEVKHLTPMQVSVTFTPRWKATLDGKPWPIYNNENLVMLKLPAGHHHVSVNYGLSWVGWTGIILSLVFLLIFAVSAFQLENIFKLSAWLGKSFLLTITDSNKAADQ